MKNVKNSYCSPWKSFYKDHCTIVGEKQLCAIFCAQTQKPQSRRHKIGLGKWETVNYKNERQSIIHILKAVITKMRDILPLTRRHCVKKKITLMPDIKKDRSKGYPSI